MHLNLLSHSILGGGGCCCYMSQGSDIIKANIHSASSRHCLHSLTSREHCTILLSHSICFVALYNLQHALSYPVGFSIAAHPHPPIQAQIF